MKTKTFITAAVLATAMQDPLKHIMTLGAIVAVSGFVTSAQAAVIATQSGQNTAFTVSSTDLLETSVVNLSDGLTLNVGENSAAGGNTSAVLNNGVFGVGTPPVLDSVTGKAESVVINFGTMTYNLDTSVNTLGYIINSIDTYAGWADFNRGSQAYTVSFSLVGSAAFSDVATVSINADGFTQERWSITEDTTGILGYGVDAIRFTLPTQQFSGVGYKELDVFGIAVPEPSSTALLGLGGVALMLRRRRK